ncbi:MAG: hypothetical protein HZA49_10055 [Planctomycetes bacterium]|nr:hypothetical protein [Planctomycetota bacterium]
MENEIKQPSELKGNVVVNLFIRNNIFYLLSALLMVIGCYLVLAPFQQITRSIADLLIYFFVVNLYEAILIAAALYIIAKKNVVRDGAILLVIEGFFLADATLINSVYYFYNIWFGLIINAIILILAMVKITLIVSYLQLSLSKAFYRFIALGLTYLYLFTAIGILGIQKGFVGSAMLFVIWSVAGLIPVALIGLAGKTDGESESFTDFRKKAQAIFSLALIGLLIVHIATVNWILSAPFYLCYLATFFISFAVILPELMPRRKAERRFHWLQYALPIAAILITLDFPTDLIFSYFPITLSPLRLSLILIALSFAYFYLLYQRWSFIFYSGLLLLLASFGYEVGVIAERVADIARWIWRRMPETRKDWGILSIISALVLFACGFLVSLRKAKLVALSRKE